jgi:hypothetical protein
MGGGHFRTLQFSGKAVKFNPSSRLKSLYPEQTPFSGHGGKKF